MRWCFAALLVVAVIVIPSRASACSCGRFDELTPESCRASKRVFAGTVAAYHWPNAIERYFIGRSYDAVGVVLAVDRVWKSTVPDRVFTTTGMGGGDCGIHPPVGTRFVVCDDEADDAPPDYLFCSRPKFEAPDLEAALGPSHDAASWGSTPPWVGLLVGALVVAVASFLARRRAIR
jgi:hypothetical protein